MSLQETFSVTELQRMCAMSEYLEESDIHMNDRTITWDGNIIYYKNKKPKATGNEYLIPIQVKGKCFDTLPSDKVMRYPVETKDMKNYLNNGGTIYILGAIEKETGHVKMFAKILLPVDIIKTIKGKEHQEHITVYLNHMASVRDLEKLCVLFYENKPKQAFLTKDMPILDYDNASEILISTLSGEYTDPAIAVVKNSITYLYMKKDGINIPMIISNLITSVSETILIKVDDIINRRYPTQFIYEKSMTTILINSAIEIKLNEEDKQATIKVLKSSNLNFEITYANAEFFVAFSRAKKCQIENVQLNKKDIDSIRIKFTDEFLEYYECIIRMGKILDELGISKSALQTDDVIKSKEALLFLRSALVEKKPVTLPFTQGRSCNIYKHIIGRKKMLLEYEKVEDNNYILRKYFEEGQRIAILVETSDGEKRCVSRWFALRGDDISNILFDEKKLLNEMEEIDESEQDQLLGLVLDCLKAYDLKGEDRMLALAEKLLDIYKHKKHDQILEVINSLQIVARKRLLNEGETKLLMPLKYSPNIYARCCACILLKQYDEFEFHEKQLSDQEREEFYTWPIVNLLPQKSEI